MLKRITFEIETITPMFLAGADQGRAELRAASIKGLLRFWWRALQAESDINELRKKEAKIFGSSEEKTGGESSFSLRVVHDTPLKPTKDKFPKQNIQVASKGKTFSVNILEYLAYGTLENKKGEGNLFNREYIPCSTRFDMILTIKDDSYEKEILRTFLVFSLFGGIGSRSRNGFGGFHVLNIEQKLESIKSDFSLSKLYSKENLNRLIKETDITPYPSFSKKTKIFKAKNTHDSWDKALGEIGKIYRGIRSSDLKINGAPFEMKHSYNKRKYIGAPIIVDKREVSFLERHAKPYLIKIAKESDKYRGYILYLPSQYCEGLEKDRTENVINHQVENKNFTTVCNEFNKFLGEYMETIF